MLSAEGCAARRARLWGALPCPCDALIVGDPQHLIYFANFVPSPFTFRSNDAGALLLLTTDRAVLVADNLLRPFLDRAHADEVVAPVWYEGKRGATYRRAALVRAALDALGSMPGRRVGIEPSCVPSGVVEGLATARPGLEWVDLEPVVRALRRSKDPDELEALRRSIRAGEAGHAAALALIEPGMTEFEAFLTIQRVAEEEAGSPALVYGDFEATPRGDRDAPPPSAGRTLHAGDLFIIDFSVVIDGYRGDFANTIAVGGRPSARLFALHEGCVAAMAAGEAMLRPGTPAREIDAAVRRALTGCGLDPLSPSHCGHGIGLGHPEPPFIVPEGDDILAEGDVVTLEPGQYGDFGGMRFEHNYLITSDGFETLTRHRLTLER